MSSYAKEVKKCINNLQADYLKGFIDYPRVENNYIDFAETFEYFPHKPFSSNFSQSSYKPISNTTMSLNKKNSLLFLSNERLITPSMAYKYSVIIDEFLDSNLNFISSQKEQEFKLILQTMQEFLEQKLKIKNLQEQEKAIKQKHNSVFKEKTNFLYFYKAPRYAFFKNATTKLNSKRYRSPQEIADYYYKKHKKEELDKKQLEELFIHKRNLQECFEDFLIQLRNNQQNAMFINNNSIISNEQKENLNKILKGEKI